MNIKTLVLLLCATSALTACVSEPMAVSHQHVTKDKSHWIVQVSSTTGVRGTPVQTAMLMYNKYSKKPQAVVTANSSRFSDKLIDAVIALGPSVVSGSYMLKGAKIDCPAGTLCGTLVQVQNSAGANAGSTATASQDN